MAKLSSFTSGIVSAVIAFTVFVGGEARVAAQDQAPPVWQFENVGQGNIIPGCINGMTLAGFEYGPDGRPVIAWREENGCGGTPRIFWTRKDAGQWHQTEFLSERRYSGGAPADYAHQLALRPGDGNPFLIYADVGPFNSINTYSSDLGANPGGGVSTYIEGLVGPQQCASVNYSPAFGPADEAPQWTTGLSLCNGGGPVRLNGTDINSSVYNARASLAIGADGTRHVLWNTGNEVYYSRFPVNATTPDLTTRLFDEINRFGGEVRIAIDSEGVLHAIVRGPDVNADWDLGAIVYLNSSDGGATWSSRQYVDPHDDPAIQDPWNANSDLSFAVDADGVPSVTFWRWTSELWYARRDGRDGSWTQQLVTALPGANPVRANQLRFDADGSPVIAYYDPAIRMMRLARPVQPGVFVPVDVAVTATASPSIVAAGETTTFTVTVTNKGVTNLDHVVLTNRLPEGASFVSASPAQGADGQWTFALTSGASTTVTITATAPFAEGAAADVATVSVDAADDHPQDNAAAAGFRVQSDQCFVPHGTNSELRGWWHGDGSAANAVGTAAEGTVVYGGVSYEPAVIGRGFKFDGTSGVVHVYHDNDNFYYPVDGSFTVEAFIKTSSPGGQIATRYECRPSCGPTAWFFSLDGTGHLSGYLRGATADLTLQGGRVINDGAFHHVALVIDRATEEARLYVDGAVDAAQPYTLGTIADSNGPYTPVVIGGRFDYYGNNVEFFNGVIDELAIHGRALSAAELGQVAAAMSQPGCGNFTPSNDTDISVVVEATPATVAPGGFATFMIGVTNTGSTGVSDVNVDNVLGGATFVDAAPNPQSAIGGFQNFNVGDLAKGERKWIAVRAIAPFVPGTISSQAHHLIDGDQNTLNDESRAVVQVVPDMCFVPPASLVGRWRADGDVSDATGGAAGSMVGGASFVVGRAGQAFGIHGNGSYVEVPDAPQLKPAQFTIAAWTLAPTFAQGGYDTVISKGSSGQDGAFSWELDSYWLGFNNGYPALFTYHQGVGTYLTQGASRLMPMQWYHLAATFDGTTARVYVNGVEVASNVIGAPIQYDSHPVPLLFGDDWQNGSANGADYSGLIDEVTIHNRALSADEMKAMVEGSTAPACLEVVPDPATPIRNGIPEARPQFSGVGMILPSATHQACTATMIAPFIVLTAAHCLRDDSTDPVFEFSLGAGRTARVTDIRVHPLFSTVDGINLVFDVALASLERSVVASWTDIIPATLRADQLTPIVEATAVGFGATSTGGRRTSGTLLVTEYVSAFDLSGTVQPDAFLAAASGSADQMFCIPGAGGPLFFEDQIVGVASFRYVAECQEDGPGFYVNTSRVADWIHTTTNELVNPPLAATTTTLQSSVNPSASGQAVTFIATVTATAATPTGEVSFVYVPTNTTLATIALADGTATFQTSALPEGTFTIQAIFTGNASYASSTATLSQVVAPDALAPIRNGNPEGRAPFNGVGMILPSATHGACTATLISRSVVLTAAHCFTDDSPDPLFEFSLGAGRTARVTDIRVHPFFSTVDGLNLAFDVAVASLDGAVTASWTDVVPVTLRPDAISPVAEATAIGFGATSTGGRRTSGTLLVTEYVSAFDLNGTLQPDAFLETNPGSADQMFCQPGAGGPLFFEDQIVGVASFRYVAECEEDGPGYYVNTSRVADWIHTTTNELGNHPPTSNAVDLTVLEGDPVELRLAIMDLDHDSVQYSLSGLPPGVLAVNEPASAGFPYPSIHLTGTPNPGSRGSYPYTLTMNDGTVTVVQSFTWTVRPPDQAPIAVDDFVTMINGDTPTIPVLANDSDPEGDEIHITSVSQPQFGSVFIGSDVRYHSERQGWFTDSFTYTIEDRYGRTATATVTVRVLSPQPDLAIAINPAMAVLTPGQRALWTMTVTNEGPYPVSGVRAREMLPPGFTLVYSSMPPLSQYDPSFELGELAGGESRTVTFEAIAPPIPGRWLHSAEVSGSVGEPMADNTANGVFDVEPAFCFAPVAGLQGLWHFDGSTADQQNRWPGEAGVLTLAPSRVGEAFAFDGGQNSYVVLPGQGPQSQQFSLAAWTRPSAPSDSDAPVISNRLSSWNGTQGPYWFGFRDGHPLLALYRDFEYTQEPAAMVLAPQAVPIDTWTHIAATYDGAVARLFVNGIEVAHQDIELPPSLGGRVVFGQGFTSAFGSVTSYVGLADDIAIYDRALTASEVHRIVFGDPVQCAIPTSRSLSLAVSASPAYVQTSGAMTLEATVTNTSDGYLEEVEIEDTLDPMVTFISSQPPAVTREYWEATTSHRIKLGAMLAGGSRTITMEVVAPFVDGHFVNHANAVDVVTGTQVHADQPFTVASEMCFVAPTGLVAHWRGEPGDPANDRLVPQYAPIGFTAGRVGQALDSGNNYTLPNQDVLTGTAFTLGSWFRVDQLPDQYWQAVLMTDRGKDAYPATTQDARVFLGIIGNRPTLLTRHQDGTQYLTQATADNLISLHTWHYLAASWDGSEARLYIDGVGVAKQEIPSPLSAPEKDERLHFGLQLVGLFDETLVYDRALGLHEIRSLFDGSPDTCHINERPILTAPGPQINRVGDHPHLELKASDPEPGDTLSFSAVGLPAGLTLDATTGVISGEVLAEGSGPQLVTVTVSDGRLSSAQIFEWTIFHRVRLNVAKGGRLLIDGQLCDAFDAPAVCSVDVAPALDASVDIQPLETADGVWSGWFRLGMGWASGGTVFVDRSTTIDYFWRVQFAVTATIADRSAAQALWSSLPVVQQTDFTRPDYVLCPDFTNVCVGYAVFGSVVDLYGMDTPRLVFDRFSGSCEGRTCEFTADRKSLEITAHYHVRPESLTIDVPAGGSVRVTNTTNGTVVCDGPAVGTATCTLEVPHGSVVTITPFAPSGGSAYWSWMFFSGQPRFGDGQDGSVTVTGDTRVGVIFWSYVHLTVNGWFDSDVFTTPPITADPLINWTCGHSEPDMSTTCLQKVPWGHPYTLTPAASGITFKGWTGPCTGTGACVLATNQADVSVAGAFAVRLTAQVGAGGRLIEGLSGVCDGGASGQTCVFEYPASSSQYRFVNAQPANPAMFWIWGGAVTGSQPQTIVHLATSQTVSLTFYTPFQATSAVPGGVVTAVLPDAHSSFIPSLDPVPTFWTGRAPVNSIVPLTAHAPAGYGFSGWTGACNGLAPCDLLITQDRPSARATFSRTPTAVPVSATTPVGTPIDLTMHGTDPEGDSLTAELSPGNPIGGQVVRTGPMSFRFTPNPGFSGEGFFYFRVSDGYSLSGLVIALIQVTPANTPAGSNVTAPALGPQGGTSPITVNFATVTQPGNTSYVTQPGVYAPPDGFRFGSPPITFDISTTATFTAPLRVCVNYGSTVYLKPAAIRLFHYENGRWIDRTVSVDTKAHIVCASVSSLSPFAIAEPEDLEGRMSGGGQLSAAGMDYRFDFHVAERHIGDERGHLDLTITTPKNGEKKESRDEFKATAIDAINFWNDPAFRPGRFNWPQPQADSAVFTGRGKWNGALGYTFEARATDQGEPGRGRDQFSITILNASGEVVATVDATLDQGNIQSERLYHSPP